MTKKQYSSSIEWLLAQIDSYLSENQDVTPECFGWRAMRDTKLVDRLRNGGDITTRKMDKVIRYLANPNHKGE